MMSVMTDSPDRLREGRLHRLGRFCARHPLPVLLLWLLLLVGAMAGNRAAGGTYRLFEVNRGSGLSGSLMGSSV